MRSTGASDSDGLEYADEAAPLLREPLDNTFDGNVRSYRKAAERYRHAPSLLKNVPAGGAYWTEEKVRQYIEGFASVCPEGDPGPSQAFADAHDTGLEAAGFRSIRKKAAEAAEVSQRLAEYIDKTTYDALTGKSANFGVVTIDSIYP